MKNSIGIAGILSLATGFLFLFLPILTLIAFSFNESRLISEWIGFSGRWYIALIQDDGFMNAAWNSAIVAIVSSTIGTGFGTALGFALARVKGFRSRVLISSMIYGPVLMPPVVIGLVLAVLTMKADTNLGLVGIMIGHTILASCLVAILVRVRLMQADPFLETVSIDLGCTPGGVWTQVWLPFLAPVILAGWLFAAVLSLGDMVLASFLSGQSAVTLPVKIYSQIKLGPTPMINAASTVLFSVTAVMITAAFRLLTKSRRLRSTSSEL